MMLGELGSVVESEGSPEAFGQRLDQLGEEEEGWLGLSRVGSDQDGEPGGSLVQNQNGLAIAGEEHEVGFPMADLASIERLRRAGSTHQAARWLPDGSRLSPG